LPNLAHKLRALVRHVLPDFGNWLGNVPDTRNALRIYYPVQKLLWTTILTFLCGARSRRDFRASSTTPAFLANLNRLTVNHGEETQHLAWVTRLSWQKHHCNVLQCRVVRTTGTETCFVWITDLELNPRNVETIANDGGRCRWKIENEGFNAQKNGEFHIEHPLGCQGHAWKNFYLLA